MKKRYKFKKPFNLLGRDVKSQDAMDRIVLNNKVIPDLLIQGVIEDTEEKTEKKNKKTGKEDVEYDKEKKKLPKVENKKMPKSKNKGAD